MLDIDRDIAKLEQLENRRRLQDNREKTAKNKKDERRKFVVGEIFLSIFPEYLDLQPQLSTSDDKIEFAPLINFLYALAAEREAVRILKASATKIMRGGNIRNDGKQKPD